MSTRRWWRVVLVWCVVVLAAPAAALGCTGDDGDGGGEASPTDAEVREYCERAAAIAESGEVVLELDPSDPSGALDGLRTASASFGRLAGVAPDRLRDDVDTMIDVLTRLGDAIDELAAPDEQSLVAVVEEFDADLRSAEEAAARVAEFTADECDVALDIAPEPESD